MTFLTSFRSNLLLCIMFHLINYRRLWPKHLQVCICFFRILSNMAFESLQLYMFLQNNT